MQARVRIQTEDFDLSAEVATLRAGDLRVGAVCSLWAPCATGMPIWSVALW